MIVSVHTEREACDLQVIGSAIEIYNTFVFVSIQIKKVAFCILAKDHVLRGSMLPVMSNQKNTFQTNGLENLEENESHPSLPSA